MGQTITFNSVPLLLILKNIQRWVLLYFYSSRNLKKVLKAIFHSSSAAHEIHTNYLKHTITHASLLLPIELSRQKIPHDIVVAFICAHLMNTIILSWLVTWRHMRRWTLCHRGYGWARRLLSITAQRRLMPLRPQDTAWCSFCQRKSCLCSDSESIIYIVTCVWGTGEERVNKREQAWLNCSLGFGILQVQRNVSIKLILENEKKSR